MPEIQQDVELRWIKRRFLWSSEDGGEVLGGARLRGDTGIPPASIDRKCKAGNLPGKVTKFSGGDLHGGKFLAALDRAYQNGELDLAGSTAEPNL